MKLNSKRSKAALFVAAAMAFSGIAELPFAPAPAAVYAEAAKAEKVDILGTKVPANVTGIYIMLTDDKNIPPVEVNEFDNDVFLSINLTDAKKLDFTVLKKFKKTKSLFLMDICSDKELSLMVDNVINDMPQLEELGFSNFSDKKKIKDISPLSKLSGSKIKSLYFFGYDLSDISPLASIKKLEVLSVGFGKVTDISPLAKLTNLKELYLSESYVKDISVLSKLTKLESLQLDFCKAKDYSVISKLTKLKYLSLSSDNISDISFLSKLTKLETLDLSANKISNIKPLEKLTKLNFLSLTNNKISDITPLAKLTDLETLCLSSNKISSVKPLEKLKKLGYIDLVDNKKLKKADIDSLKKKLPKSTVISDYDNIIS